MQAPPPPPASEVAQPAATRPAALTIVSKQTENVTIASSDRPMTLVKAGHTEQAILRYILFIVDTKTVLQPKASPGSLPEPDRMRWSYSAYIQRQLCFTSITGLFSCSAAETIALDDKSDGEAPLPTPDTSEPSAAPEAAPTGASTATEPPKPAAAPSDADFALASLSNRLRVEATAKFDEDNRLKVDPLLKAAGVRASMARHGG
jgi:hypothetical protein